MACPGDTAPRARYTYRLGQLEGPATLWNPTTGQPLIETELVRNQITGLMRVYHPTTGALALEARMRDDHLNGLAVHYHAGTGHPEAEGFYVDSLREGLWAHYYADGSLRDSGFYEGGLREGLWGRHDSATGQRIALLYYRSGLPDSLAALWDTGGHTLSLPAGTLRGGRGLWPLYDPENGRLIEAFMIAGGEPSGRVYRYDSQVRPVVIGRQRQGQPDSVWTFLAYDGAGTPRVLRREQPRPGGDVRRVWLYDEAGGLRTMGLETTTTPSLPDSVWTVYLPEGAVFQRLRYRRGLLMEAGAARIDGRELLGSRLPAGGMGPLKVYDLTGRLLAEGPYEAGQRTGQWIEHVPATGERWQGLYHQDRKTGVWERRSRRGRLLEQATPSP